jgi:integrase
VFAGEEGAALRYSVIDTQHDRTLEKLNWTSEEPGKRLRIYDFRHTALTRLYQSGAGTFTLKAIAGHSSVKTTERYINLPENHHMEAFAGLEAFNERAAAEAEKKAAKSA